MLIVKVVLCLLLAAALSPLVLSPIFNDKLLSVPKVVRRVVGCVVAMLCAVTLIGGVGQIHAGHRGVVLRFGAVTGRVLNEGIYFITPVVESVVEMDVSVRALTTPAKAASRDLQDVNTTITLNYRLDPSHVDTTYRDLREEYESRVISPAVLEAVKACTAMYDAEELIQKRAEVRSKMEGFLMQRLTTHNIVMDAMSITNFEFSHEFSNAIEAKVVASQAALRAENDLRRIKVEAEQRVATAKAEAEAIKIQAEAIQAQGGREYVNLKAIEKWDGKLPQWIAGGTVPFVNIPVK